MNQPKTFIVWKRYEDVVVPHQATLVKSYAGWTNGKPVGLPKVTIRVGGPVEMAELYAGHTEWIAGQLDKRDQAIKSERARRAARKAQGSAPGTCSSSTAA